MKICLKIKIRASPSCQILSPFSNEIRQRSTDTNAGSPGWIQSSAGHTRAPVSAALLHNGSSWHGAGPGTWAKLLGRDVLCAELCESRNPTLYSMCTDSFTDQWQNFLGSQQPSLFGASSTDNKKIPCLYYQAVTYSRVHFKLSWFVLFWQLNVLRCVPSLSLYLLVFLLETET